MTEADFKALFVRLSDLGHEAVTLEVGEQDVTLPACQWAALLGCRLQLDDLRPSLTPEQDALRWTTTKGLLAKPTTSH